MSKAVAAAKAPRLKEIYMKEVVPSLMKEFKYTNVMQVPKIDKIVVNMGIGGDAVKDVKSVDAAVRDLTAITGQKPSLRMAKKSIATFKLRVGMPVGATVTLRGASMYEFLDRLVNFTMPRIRDFKGVSDKAFDGRGNYTLGISEQIIFPEIEYDKIDKIRGMNVTVTTTANTDEEAKALLRGFGMPFRK